MLTSGFSNAPITKYALVFIVTSSIAVSIADTKYLFYIQVTPHLWRYWQWWRLLIWQTCYTNSTEVLEACMVLYSLRVIERLWGSRKLASFLISTLPYTTLLPPLLLTLLLRPLSLNTLNYLPAGPTTLLFALLAQYHAAIPTTYKYLISTSPSPSSQSPSSSTLTLHLSDKSTTYLLATQLALSQFPHSLLPAATGWIIGYAWRAELLPGRLSSPTWRIPAWVYGGQDNTGAGADQQRRRRAGEVGGSSGGGSTGVVAEEENETERYEGLRRRLEGESRAAAAAAAGQAGAGAGVGAEGGASGSGSGAEGGDMQRRRPLAGQILDRFRGAF